MKVVFPDINPLRIILNGYEKLFADEIPYHEETVWYNSKWASTDVIYLFFAIPDDAEYTMEAKLYDCNGWEVATLDLVDTETEAYPGYLMYKITADLSTIRNEGIYYIHVFVSDNTDVEGTVFDFCSEPIHLKTSWPKTLLLEYYNEINDFDIPFEDLTDFVFQLRVEGGFPSSGFSPQSKDTIFIDQNHIPVLLDSIPYNVEKIQFGSAVGITNWQADCINRALSCTHFYVDGIRYCKNEGAKLEPTHENAYPLSGWSIDLIRVEDEGSTSFSLSRIYVLGAGEEAFRAGTGLSMFPAKPIE